MADPLISPQVSEYLQSLVPERHAELRAMEERARETDFPIIGPVAGHFCYLVAKLIGARRIFELGSGFGYSTAWFARAVAEHGSGEVHHVVWDAALSREARERLARMGFAGLVRYHVGEAVETLRQIEGPFDLIFNDIDKRGYPGAFPVIAQQLRPGGVLIVDNLLWSGRIFDPADTSPDTEGVRAFTRVVFDDPGWTATIVPIRDGLLMARKA